MRFQKLILDNFLSYDHLEYDFENRPLQIQGLNLTDDRQKTNGTGKSGIPTAIEICLTGTNSRGVRDNEIPTYGKKSARIQLFTICDVRNEILHIDWTIKVKGSNGLAISIQKIGSEKWEKASFSNVNDGKRFISEWFAIDREDLFNYFVVNKTRFKSFFSSSNAEKIALINRFSDASILDGIEEIDKTEHLDKKYSLEHGLSKVVGKIDLTKENLENEVLRNFDEELEEKKDEIKSDIEDHLNEIELLNESISDCADESESLKAKIAKNLLKISDLNESKLSINKDIGNSTDTLTGIKNSLQKAKEKETSFSKTDWKKERFDYEAGKVDKKKDLRMQNEKISENEAKKTKVLSAISEINVKLGGKITCPSCSYSWIEDDDLDALKIKKGKLENLSPLIEKQRSDFEKLVSEIQSEIKDFENSISEINAQEQEENKKLSLIQNQVSQVMSSLLSEQKHQDSLFHKVQEIESLISKIGLNNDMLKNQIEETVSEAKGFESEIKDLRKSVKSLKSDIKNLSVSGNESLISDLKNQLSELDSEKQDFENRILKTDNKLYEINTWIQNFKQFKMYLANQSLEVIEYHMNRFLIGMGNDIRVKLEGFKVLANGSMKEEITPYILRERERSFNSFSGGEKGRILFASILANRHMINATHPYGGLDFLSVDEVFEGIDSEGIKYLIEAAKELKITILIITHVTDEDTDSDTLLTIKENGISRIEKGKTEQVEQY